MLFFILSYLVTPVLILFTTLLFYYKYQVNQASKHHKQKNDLYIYTRDKLPSIWRTLPSLIFYALLKKEGKLLPGFDKVPNIQISVGGVRIDSNNLRQYNQICGPTNKAAETSQGEVPICFPQVLAFSLTPEIVSMSSFPLSPFGLIHIRNVITQYKAILPTDSLDLFTSLHATRNTEKGIEIDVKIKAIVRNPEKVKAWKSIETLLSRFKNRPKNTPRSTVQPLGEEGTLKNLIISVPGNIGRKYAAITGDYNPHHLYSLTAKLFGFRRAIAHGMWFLQKCISEIESMPGINFPPLPRQLDASFKLPVFLPSKVLLQVVPQDNSSIKFGLFSENGKLPHATGSIFTLTSEENKKHT